MSRGNNKEWIFRTENDKRFYYNNLQYNIKKTSLKLIAWCIMNNHVHLLICGELEEISNFILIINTTYGVKYNRDYNRVGHIFQGRFKSETVEEREYFRGLIRYIHNNPVKAKMVVACRDYKWSSYNEYVHKKRIIEVGSVKLVMKYFDNDIKSFIDYHTGNDTNEYIELSEQIRDRRIEIVELYRDIYCERYGLKSHLLGRWDKEKIVESIISETQITFKLISEVLGVSLYKIYDIRNRTFGDSP